MSAIGPGSSLEEVAREAVRQFNDDLEPGPLPEELEAWNSTFVSAIRTHKDQYRGSKDLKNLLRIAGELLYGKEIHWAMELVQNAEDAGAKRMAFVFEPERILVYNDGEPFRARDVWAICSAGHTAKRNKIGFFGIGFKSVYKLTAEPYIYSGPYALRIEDKLYPTAIDVRARSRRGAWFVLPVLRDQRSKLAAMLGQLVSTEFAQVLLTLTSLETIRIVDRTGTGLSGRFMRRSLRRSPQREWDECEVGGSWDWAAPRLWRRFFHETGPVPAGIEREGRSVAPGDRSLVILARPVDGDTDDLRVHCFLPTAVLSQLRWLVQADFEPSASREQLRQSDWNAWLMREVGTALAVAVTTSARALNASPWDLIPLDAEVRDIQQREALAQALPNLRQATFVATRRGWRAPEAATWGLFPGMTDVVREGDLRAATGSDVSYVRDEVLGPIEATAESRAELVLKALGAESVGPAEIVKLLAADDADFERFRRDGRWWVSALGLMVQYGDSDAQEALAGTRCLPIRGGGRTRPSPTVDEDGYLVAFSRSDITEDLRAYLGESEVYLLETFLTRQSDGRGTSSRARKDQDSLSAIAAMLQAEPFNVAAEAGPYHVVASLVIPRLNALARKESLSSTEVDHAWRMLEYVRQKWPSYLSEYRKWRNKNASDPAIAAELGPKLFVVAQARPPGETRRLWALTETYLSSALIGFEAMDVALEDDPDLSVIDAVHAKALRVTIRRAGGRSRTKPPALVEFLKLLGAPLGPRVQGAAFTQLSPRDVPWVDWSTLPAGARGRVALDRDWESPDVARFATRWARMSTRTRQRRGAALLRAIEADWPRLSALATASARYFYGSWNNTYATVPSSWVGRLRQTAWLPSQAGTHEYPTSLVLDTPTNRSALGRSPEGVLKWSATAPEAVTALGVRARPTIDRVVETLSALRASESEFTPDDTFAIARACYRTLADHVREAGPEDTETGRLVATRMRGGAGRGLIYAPPPAEVEGERWWPPSRVVQLDAMKWAGPYLGQLAGRYPSAAALWETLGIRRDLTVELACEIIARDLTTGEPSRAHEYYGRLVSFIEEARQARSKLDVPALTSFGWQPAATAWWSNRPEVLDALATSVSWWRPGTRDPSSVRRAASFLGVREVKSAKLGGPLAERWDVGGEGTLEIGQETRWELAVRTWPHLLRDERDPERWLEIDALASVVDRLRVKVVSRLRVGLTFSADGPPVHAPIAPHVALRTSTLTLVARSAPDAFAARAAQCLAQLVETDQHAAARALELLLVYAAHDPDELERLATRHAVNRYQHREFTFVPADYEELNPAEPITKQVRPRRKVPGGAVANEPTFTPLADPLRYGLVATFVATPSGRKPEPLVGGRLKPPATDEEPGDEGGSNEPRRPPKPKMGYANTDIEVAARPFVEEYELETRGTTIIRQGPNVGADYLASDGRYIEVKSFGGDAPDAVDLEPPEWRAAQHPEIGGRFWVYIVEHLRDGRPPEITAVFNPVSDDATTKEPTGKLRIRGWKNSKTQHFGEFGERSAVEESPAVPAAGGRRGITREGR